MKLIEITQKVILIKSKLAFENFSNPRLRYEYTRGYWDVSKNRAENAQFAILVSPVKKNGFVEILEVYEPIKWFLSNGSIFTERPPETLSWLDTSDKQYEFIGDETDDETKEEFIGKFVKWSNPKNAIMYINI